MLKLWAKRTLWYFGSYRKIHEDIGQVNCCLDSFPLSVVQYTKWETVLILTGKSGINNEPVKIQSEHLISTRVQITYHRRYYSSDFHLFWKDLLFGCITRVDLSVALHNQKKKNLRGHYTSQNSYQKSIILLFYAIHAYSIENVGVQCTLTSGLTVLGHQESSRHPNSVTGFVSKVYRFNHDAHICFCCTVPSIWPPITP